MSLMPADSIQSLHMEALQWIPMIESSSEKSFEMIHLIRLSSSLMLLTYTSASSLGRGIFEMYPLRSLINHVIPLPYSSHGDALWFSMVLYGSLWFLLRLQQKTAISGKMKSNKEAI